MSQIAAALARSKGKKVEPVAAETSVVPPISVSAPPLPTKAVAAPKPKASPKLIAIVAGSVLAVGLAVWFVLSAAPTPPVIKKAATAVTPPAARPVPPVATVAPAVVPVAAPPAPVPVVPATAAPVVDPGPMAPELVEQLKKLVISARRAGTDPRIVIGRTVYIPGDTVIEGVVLESVAPDRLVFRDAEHRRYERRF